MSFNVRVSVLVGLALGSVPPANGVTVSDAGRPDAAYERSAAARYAAMTAEEMDEEERAIARRIHDLELVPPKLVVNPPEKVYALRPVPDGLLGFLGYAWRSRIDRQCGKSWKFAMNNGVAATRGGRIWRTWTAGEDGPLGITLGAWSDDGGKTWTSPRLIVDPHFGTEGWMKGVPLMRYILFSSLWTDPDGILHLFVTQLTAMQNGRGTTWEFVCKNPDADSPVWSKARYIWHCFTHNPLTVLKDGTWVMPVAPENNPNNLWPALKSCYGGGVLLSKDKGLTWTPGGFVRPKGTNHWCEQTVVEKRDGTLWAVLRTGNGPQETFSIDGGRSWSELRPCAWFRNPVARHVFQKLSNGTILLVKNGDDRLHFDNNYGLSGNGRNKLKAYFSTDDGESWSDPIELDLRDGVAYPAACELPDGSVYVTWEHDRRGAAEICGKRLRPPTVR